MTGPAPEHWTAISKLVSSFLQRPDAEPFREPVDWQNLGLFDYPKIIKKPMDLGTIKKNVMDRKYKTLKHVDDDIKLVWTNCMTYNADGSDFFILARNLDKKWNDKFAKLCNDFQLNSDGSSVSVSKDKSGGDPSSSSLTGGTGNNSTNLDNAKVSLDAKRQFGKSLYKLTKEDLGKILVEVEKHNPSALTKNNAEDEVEFNVDKLTPQVFNDLVTFVKNCNNHNNNNSTTTTTNNNANTTSGGGGGDNSGGGGNAGAGGLGNNNGGGGSNNGNGVHKKTNKNKRQKI